MSEKKDKKAIFLLKNFCKEFFLIDITEAKTKSDILKNLGKIIFILLVLALSIAVAIWFYGLEGGTHPVAKFLKQIPIAWVIVSAFGGVIVWVVYLMIAFNIQNCKNKQK